MTADAAFRLIFLFILYFRLFLMYFYKEDYFIFSFTLTKIAVKCFDLSFVPFRLLDNSIHHKSVNPIVGVYLGQLTKGFG
jgi:hypothetical protein